MNLLNAILPACLFLLGLFLGTRLTCRRRKRHKTKTEESKTRSGYLIRSVTRLLFVTTQIFALGWVSISYFIAVYATVRLCQPFPVVELSSQAIITLLGVSALKVVENIFEHNSGSIFGQSNTPSDGSSEGEG